MFKRKALRPWWRTPPAVLVTSSAYALEVFGQLYRDRADCENGFDELKNQWGRGLNDPGH